TGAGNPKGHLHISGPTSGRARTRVDGCVGDDVRAVADRPALWGGRVASDVADADGLSYHRKRIAGLCRGPVGPAVERAGFWLIGAVGGCIVAVVARAGGTAAAREGRGKKKGGRRNFKGFHGSCLSCRDKRPSRRKPAHRAMLTNADSIPC